MITRLVRFIGGPRHWQKRRIKILKGQKYYKEPEIVRSFGGHCSIWINAYLLVFAKYKTIRAMWCGQEQVRP